MVVIKIIDFCSENHTTHLNTFFFYFLFLGARYLNVNTGIPVSLWDVMLSYGQGQFNFTFTFPFTLPSTIPRQASSLLSLYKLLN